jgi:thioredoxin 1
MKMKIIETKEEYENILKDNKSVFVDFYADWCGPCKMTGPVVEELEKIHPEVKFVKVNVDNNPEIASLYGIMSIPTLIAFKNGEAVDKTLGFHPQPALEAMVQKTK